MPSSQTVATDLVAQAVRARQRRAFMLASHQDTLHALGAVEEQIERNVKALALLPAASEQAFATQRQASHQTTAERDALVHVWGACLVQQPAGLERDQRLLDYVAQFLDAHRAAVRDALWFFPIERDLFSPRDQHLDILLNSHDARIRGLGVELVGRHGSLRCAPRITTLAKQASSQAHQACELALARCGALAKPEIAIRHALQGGHDHHALQLISASGQLQALHGEGYLRLAQHPEPGVHRRAWLLAALRDPQAARQHAHGTEMDPRLRAHVLALCGYAPDLIDTLAAIAKSPQPPQPWQREQLLLSLGSVDAAVDVLPTDTARREHALRSQLLATLRRAHLGVHNDADTAPWQAQRILVPDSLQTATRLRYGQAYNAQAMLDQRMADLGAELRQALYVEQGARANGAQALSAYGPARLQRATLGVVEWVQDHLEQPVQARGR